MEKSGKHYKQLNAEKRATIMLMKREGSGLREIGRFLKRSPSTISNEIARDLGCESGYVASLKCDRLYRGLLQLRKKAFSFRQYRTMGL